MATSFDSLSVMVSCFPFVVALGRLFGAIAGGVALVCEQHISAECGNFEGSLGGLRSTFVCAWLAFLCFRFEASLVLTEASMPLLWLRPVIL